MEVRAVDKIHPRPICVLATKRRPMQDLAVLPSSQTQLGRLDGMFCDLRDQAPHAEDVGGIGGGSGCRRRPGDGLANCRVGEGVILAEGRNGGSWAN